MSSSHSDSGNSTCRKKRKRRREIVQHSVTFGPMSSEGLVGWLSGKFPPCLFTTQSKHSRNERVKVTHASIDQWSRRHTCPAPPAASLPLDVLGPRGLLVQGLNQRFYFRLLSPTPTLDLDPRLATCVCVPAVTTQCSPP